MGDVTEAVTDVAGTDPVMGDVTCVTCTEILQVFEVLQFKVAVGVSFTSTLGPLSFLSGASLRRLAGEQAKLLYSIKSRDPVAAVLQPSAGACEVHPPGPPVQPVHFNTVPAPRRRTSRFRPAYRPARPPCLGIRQNGGADGSAQQRQPPPTLARAPDWAILSSVTAARPVVLDPVMEATSR